MANTNKLQLTYGDGTLGINGNNFHYIFNYGRGGMESLVIDGREWLYREPRPTFWRATTDNDRGNAFSQKSAQWLGADMFIETAGITIIVDDKEIVFPGPPANNIYSADEYAASAEIIFTYKTQTIPRTEVKVSYAVETNGDITVKVHYTGKKDLPQLPVFGMRFILPTTADEYSYEGLSGETYPDRMAGGIFGQYTIEGLPVTSYLVPQDCGMHMQTNWLKVVRSTVKNNADGRHSRFALKFTNIEKPFAFSCLPYTAEELENATHLEELPMPRRTVVCILGAVRGVGGIDSWGRDVGRAYHISAAKDIDYSFKIGKV